MKYGVHLAMWMTSWQDDVVPYLENAARLGFDGAELSLLGMDDANIFRLRGAAAELEMELTCTAGLSEDADITSDNPVVRAAGVAYLEWAIRTVAALDSSLLTGVIYAPGGCSSPSNGSDGAPSAPKPLNGWRRWPASWG